MKKLVLVCIVALASLSANAQYKWGIGAAWSGANEVGGGLSIKAFTSPRIGYDFTIGWGNFYFDATGIYEIHAPLAENLKWYYGPGLHIGSWNGGRYGNDLFLGIDGALGLELKPNIPFSFSLDLRPRLDLAGNNWDGTNHWIWWGGQFAVRYTFGR